MVDGVSVNSRGRAGLLSHTNQESVRKLGVTRRQCEDDEYRCAVKAITKEVTNFTQRVSIGSPN